MDNENPYLNEQIIYTLQFCRRVKIASASLTEQPSFDGFLVESLGKEREYQKVINGQQYAGHGNPSGAFSAENRHA